jgi:hypothetical protein
VFLGLYDATSPYKNLVKNWKNELVPACDSEANFFWRQVQFLKAEATGVVLAVSFFFWQCKAHPAITDAFGNFWIQAAVF